MVSTAEQEGDVGIYGLRKMERAIHLQDAVSTFVQLKKDYCYFLRREDGEITIFIVWVDDIYQYH